MLASGSLSLGIFHFLQRILSFFPGMLGVQSGRNGSTATYAWLLALWLLRRELGSPRLMCRLPFNCANFSTSAQVSCVLTHSRGAAFLHFLQRIILWLPKGWWNVRYSSALSSPLLSGPSSQIRGASQVLSRPLREESTPLSLCYSSLLAPSIYTVLDPFTTVFSPFVIFLSLKANTFYIDLLSF